MSARRGSIALLAFLAFGSARADEPPAAPDTSNWSCKFCKFDSGAEGWIEPAVGWLSSSSFHFGDYRGLDDRGLVLDLGGAWRYRNAEKGDRIDVRVEHAGLDSRSFSASTARQGRYTSSISYDVVPHLLSRDARTPFDAQGRLPPGWTTSGSTGGMSDLPASLHGVLVAQQRERLALGGSWIPHPATDLHFDYRRDEVTGTGSTGGTFLTLASQLPKNLQQKADRFEATAAYHNAFGRAQLGVTSSFFDNEITALTWQNPYGAPNAGATEGQMAVAPDNRAHRITAALSSPPAQPWQVTAQVSYGRMLQDDRFLPATVNPNETAALPRTTLDGRVDTTLATARAAYRVRPRLNVSADFLHDERRNKTPVDAWTQVVMDTFTGGTRTNVPYSFTRNRWRATAEQTFGARLALGIEQDSRERQLASQYDTRERTIWGRLGWRAREGAALRARYAHSERDGAGAYVAAADVPAQNPLLRPFQLADRRRDELRGDLSLAHGTMAGAINVSYAHNRYPGTLLGRTGDQAVGYGIEGTAQPLETLSIGAFAQRQVQTSAEAGSENFGVPDWFADRSDTSSTAGLHADWKAPHDIDVGGAYTLAIADGATLMTTSVVDTAFPDVATRWHDARLFVRYPVRPDLTVRLDLEREIYTASDWALDGVGPSTIPNLLAQDQGTRAGSATALLLSARYQF